MRLMKCLLLTLLITMMMSFSCYAQISESDLNIGGIYYGQTMEDVVKKLGQSVRRERTPPAGSAPVFRCGNSEIMVRFDRSNRVSLVLILRGNDLFTPRGIGVGSTYDEVIKTYGKPDEEKSSYVKYCIPKGKTARTELIFWINTDRIVRTIEFTYWDDADYLG